MDLLVVPLASSNTPHTSILGSLQKPAESLKDLKIFKDVFQSRASKGFQLGRYIFQGHELTHGQRGGRYCLRIKD